MAIPYHNGYGGFGLGGGYQYSRFSLPIYHKKTPLPIAYYSSYTPKYHPRYYSKISYYPSYYYDHYGYDQYGHNKYGYGKMYGRLHSGYYR